MSKILAFNQDYSTNNSLYSPKKTNQKLNLTPTFKSPQQRLGLVPNFSGGTTDGAAKLVKMLTAKEEKVIDKKTGVVGWFSRLLANHQGELENQIINACFTTTFAPFFIAFNPFADTDEKTKKYTALRQPISAIVSLSGGLFLTNLLNGWYEDIASKGEMSYIDLRIKPDDKYLKRQFKKELNDAKDKDAFLAQFDSKIDEKVVADKKNNAKAYKKACLKEYTKGIQDGREKLFARLIGEDPENLKLKYDEILGAKIPKLETKAEVEEYVANNNLRNVKFSDFMEEHFHFEFHGDNKTGKRIKIDSVEEKLGKINAMEFLRELGLFKEDEVHEIDLQRSLWMVRQGNTTAAEIKAAYPTWTDKQISTLLTSLSKNDKRGIDLAIGQANSEKEAITLNQFLHQLGIVTERDPHYNELQKWMNKNMHEVINDLTGPAYLKNFDVLDSESKKTNKAGYRKIFENKKFIDFATNIMKNTIKTKSSYFGTYKNFVGIFFNLFITATTCTILNWIYPRLVAALFPRLVESSDKKGGNK